MRRPEAPSVRMLLDKLFHLSFYITLALAAACLTLPATFFLGWMPIFFGAALVMLFLAWRQEGNWVLSETAANQLGVFLATAAAGWMLFQLPGAEDELLAGGVHWPAGLLPHLGPFLVILLIVKLFRPKRLPDYWVIQTMGLILVGLATVLADEQMFGVLLAIYLTSLIWSLTLYYPVREHALQSGSAAASATSLFRTSLNAHPLPTPERWWGLPRVTGWTALVGLGGFLLFLVAPRFSQSQWNALQLSTRSRSTSKTGESGGMDLNRTGRVELSEEPAFAVTVRDHQGQIKDASVIPRWRLETLEIYTKGRWYPFARTPVAIVSRVITPRPLPVRPLPTEVKQDQWLITFDLKPIVAGGFVLAEPVDLNLGIGLAPRLDDQPHGFGLFSLLDGCDIFGVNVQNRRRSFSYSQVIHRTNTEPSRAAINIYDEFADWLVGQPVPEPLESWTRDLLARLPGLTDAVRQLDERQRVAPAAQGPVAESLCRHLASSGEYRYSLELRRDDRRLDPTADFLINTKEGHCERYAGGLALMLRALGIRCRVVKGYLGADTDETGQGIVRLNQAHSWVEALVPGDTPGTWRWLTLDPTPSSTTQDSLLNSWWQWLTSQLDGYAFWRQWIMDFDGEQQLRICLEAGRWLLTLQGAATALLATGLGFVVVRGRGWFQRALAAMRNGLSVWRSDKVEVDAGWNALVRVLRRFGGPTWHPWQTPHEYAAVASAALAGVAATSDLAPLPLQMAAALYRIRYGGQPLPLPEIVALSGQLRLLRARLKGVHWINS